MTGVLCNLLVFYPFAAGLLSYCIGRKDKKARDLFTDAYVIVEFAAALLALLTLGPRVASGEELTHFVPGICGFGLHFTFEGFRLIYALIAALMWMMTTILSKEYFAHHHHRNRFYLFLLLTLGATMGVFLSADLYTTFVFFEIMSFTSYVWVAQEENPGALRAAGTYLAVAVIGGLVMLMGVFLVYNELGTLRMAELLPAARACENKTTLYIAGTCMLFGFGAKAGAFPLHIWLPKAHPVAPAPASALLSGVLTKTGIFGVLVVSCNLFLHDGTWGKLILGIGVLTMFGGALLAVFSIDLKRTLACSSMSQIGFILVGVGMQCLLGEENALAVHGTFLHMCNHSLIKLVLFMAAGAVYMNTHALDLNKIRGFGRKKPALKVIFLVGALAIGGIPGFSGYVSKTLLHESIVEFGGGAIMKAVECIFLFSGGLTVAYMTKLFIAVFVEKNADPEVQRKFDEKKQYMNLPSTFALGGSALVLFIWGLFPHGIMGRAASFAQEFMHMEEEAHRVHFFNLTNLTGGMISISIGALVYLLFIRKVLMKAEKKGGRKAYVNLWPSWWDMENLLYRPVILKLLPEVFGFLSSIVDRIPDTCIMITRKVLIPYVLGLFTEICDRAVDFCILVTRKILIPYVFGFFCRLCDSFLDLGVIFLRNTAYRDTPLPHEREEGTFFTELVGRILNRFRDLRNRTWGRKDPVETDYVHAAAVKGKVMDENFVIIQRSLSFGLMLAGVGFILIMLYLLLA